MTFKNKIILIITLSLLTPFLSQAASYDFYVDGSNTGIENGTQANPYNTITEAITAAESNPEDNRKIYIASGEYREQLNLTTKIELRGESENNTIVYGKDATGSHFKYTIKMNNRTKIKNIQIKYGKTGVLVNNDDKATIDNCKIKKFKKIGIEVEKAKRNDDKLLKIEDSKIYDGKGKAMYIRSRKIEIIDNEIYDNDEEGIDLRSKVKGKIKNNDIHDNGEGGIEMELKSANIKITNNNIEDGGSSGISLQYRGKNRAGSIILKRNDIEDNRSWGIRCNAPSKGEPPFRYFKDATTLIRNTIDDNKKGDYSAMCRF